MLSRVADSIYWMSRYIERAENLARFVDVTFGLMLDYAGSDRDLWQALVHTSGDHELFAERYREANRDNVVRFLAFDPEYSNSILSCVQWARENARSVRETISSKMWEQVNSLYLHVRNAADDPRVLEEPGDFLEGLKQGSHSFVGVTDATMSFGEGYHFGRMGRLMERADKTSRLLDVKYFLLSNPREDRGMDEDLQWAAVLRSVGGLEMFRKRHHGISPRRVIGFLVLDRLFPRSLMHCVNGADDSLHAISGSPSGTFWNPAEKRMGMLRSELAYHSVEEIVAVGLHDFLDLFQSKLNGIGQAIHDTFIAMTPSETGGEESASGGAETE